MTTAAYHALTLLIRADLELFEDLSEQLHRCLKTCHDSQCDLVGIVACRDGMAMAFDADQLGIREMEHRINALKEFPGFQRIDPLEGTASAARFYVCREGKAERRDRGEFLQAMWLRVFENAGKKD